MKNQRLAEALKEMDKARLSADSAIRSTNSARSASWVYWVASAYWSARSATWSARWSASSAYWSVKTNEKEVLEILKGKLTCKKEQKNEINN